MAATVVSSDVLLYWNGQIYSQVSGFTWNSTTPQKTVMALDSLVPYEILPIGSSIAGNVNVFRTQSDGGLEGKGITTQFGTLANQKYNTVSLRQRSTDLLLFEARYVVVTSQNWHAGAKGIITGNFSFQGILWSTEAAPGSTSG